MPMNPPQNDDSYSRRNAIHIRPNLLMGQRFLTSRPILEKIIDAAGLSKDDTALEIGPGTGALTIELAKKAGRVIAVEKDKKLFELLELRLKRLGIANVRLILGDILKLVENSERETMSGKQDRLAPLVHCSLLTDSYKVVANIPYYLTSRLIRIFLESENQPAEMFLMVQKEVAERIIAKPPRMNLLALSVQAYAEPEIMFGVPRHAFSPTPRVDSAFIRFKKISRSFFDKNGIEPDRFFRIVRAGFRAKRKTLANNLEEYLGDKKTAKMLLKKCAIDPGARAETLSLENWAILAREADTASQ